MLKALPLFDSITNENHKRYPSTNAKQDLNSNNIFYLNDSSNTRSQCATHKRYYNSFCITCGKDICSFCKNNHISHHFYYYKDFIPIEKEINLLKRQIKKNSHDYKMLINEIEFWKKLLDKKLANFTNYIQMFNSCDDIDFIENFDLNNSNFNDFIRFRKIYNAIISENETDIKNNILMKCVQNNYNEINIPFYNNQDLLIAQNILKELISSNDDINNMNKFISCSSMIINYIVELNKKCEAFYKKERKRVANEENNIFQAKTYSGKMNIRAKYMNDNNKSKYSNYDDKKIIEKFIDFKEYYSQNQNNNIVPNNYVTSITPKNKPLKSILKNKTNSNNSFQTSFSSYNILNTPKFSCSNSDTIYSKKCPTPKLNESFSKKNQIDNPNNKNDIVDLVLDSTKTIEGNKYSNKSCSIRNIYKLNKPFKSLDLSEPNAINKNNNIFLNYSLRENNNILFKNQRTICNLKKNNFVYEMGQKEKEAKTYIHKKLTQNNTQELGDRKYNQMNNKLNNNYYNQNVNDKILEYDSLSFNDKKYNINNYQRIKKKSNEIKSSLFKLLKYSKDESKNKNEEEKKCNYINEKIPKIIKTKYDEKFVIDENIPIYVGLDLGDTECKLSLVNQTNNEIKLISFKKDLYIIPTVIYFDEKKEDVKIGYDAENSGIVNPSQIVFNLMKFINIDYDEIIGKKELWPFKLYKNESTKSPYIKINYNGQKDKIFYFEDILTQFIQKLFEEFFKKIILKNNNNNNIIKLFLDLSLPNYLSFLQKKIIEKIFQNYVFSDNIKYNGYKIFLQSIKLENPTNIANLYNDLRNVNNHEKNILVLLIDGCSINLSMINKKRILYEVKGIESAALGEEDFTDNYIYYSLRNLDEKINNKFLQSPSLLYQLRKAITLAKKNFNFIPQTQLDINMLNEEGENIGNKKFSILLKKNDYEKSCEDYFKKINILIKNILSKSKLSEMDIDDIILIGETAKSSKIKLILYDIFKNNKKINKLLLLSDSNSNQTNKDINKDNLVSIGCALQLMNNNNILLSNYIFTDISPYSFGIETIDGLMDVVIHKGKKLPYKNKKLIKINNKSENIYINIFEGDDMFVKNNKFITSAVIDKSIFKGDYENDFIEILVQLEIDCDLNLKCYIIEPKSNNRFECLINIDVVKS